MNMNEEIYQQKGGLKTNQWGPFTSKTTHPRKVFISKNIQHFRRPAIQQSSAKKGICQNSFPKHAYKYCNKKSWETWKSKLKIYMHAQNINELWRYSDLILMGGVQHVDPKEKGDSSPERRIPQERNLVTCTHHSPQVSMQKVKNFNRKQTGLGGRNSQVPVQMPTPPKDGQLECS